MLDRKRQRSPTIHLESSQRPSGRRAGSLNNLANVYYANREYEEAATVHERVLAIRQKALGAEHRDVAASLSNLAEVHDANGEYEEAAALCGQALAIWEKAQQAHKAYHEAGEDSAESLAKVAAWLETHE